LFQFEKKTHFSILCFHFASFRKSKTIVMILKFNKQTNGCAEVIRFVFYPVRPTV
jgi:hypothetical protein